MREGGGKAGLGASSWSLRPGAAGRGVTSSVGLVGDPSSSPPLHLHPGAWRPWGLGQWPQGGRESSAEPGLLCLQDVSGPPRELRPRLCHLRKGPQGYGFNLHSDKSRPGQYIRSVDPGSPAAHSGLRAQDRLIEVPVTHTCVSVPLSPPSSVSLACVTPPPQSVSEPVSLHPRGVSGPCPCVCVWAGRSLLEEGTCREPELVSLLLPRLVTVLMHV